MADDLRKRVRAAAREALAAAGDISKVDRTALVKEFMGKGASRSSLFSWVKAALLDGAAVSPLVEALETIEAAVAAPRALVAITRGESGAGAHGPAPAAGGQAGFDRVIGVAGAGLVEAMDLCIAAARDTMKHSRHPDGSIRLGKTLLAASEHMRRVIETVARIQELMVSGQKIEAFYQALVAELREESPDFVARVLARMERPEARYRDA